MRGMSESGLPMGWASAALSEVAHVNMGQSPPSSAYNDAGLGLPFLQGKGEFGLLRPTPVKWCTAPKKIAEPDDVLLSVRAPVGPTNLAPERCCIGRGLAAVRPLAGIANRFVLYQIRAREPELVRQGHGVTFKAIRKKELTSWPLLVAPIPEQHRIVARIESLFARLDEGIAALKQAEANLKRYRASVLKSAVEGRLTEQWRRENPAEETGQELLARTPVPPRPARYRTRFRGVIAGHPALSVGATGLALPDEWSWAPLVDVARLESGHTPSRRRPDWWDGDVPWVGIKDARVHHGGTIFETVQMTNKAGLANSAARLLPTDTVCLSRTASVGYVVKLGRPMATSQDFVNWICTEALDPRWLQIVFLADPTALRRFGKGSTHTTVYFPEVLSLHIALPPLAEQRAIVAEVDSRLSDCAQQGVLFTEAQESASTLRQSILKRAFEGRLVPQDPADEPASVLLQRIRAESNASSPPRPRKRRRKSSRPGPGAGPTR